MKIGILQTAPNNCEKLDELAGRYPGVSVLHYVDECVWVHYEAAGCVVTEKCHDMMAADFNKLIDAGCEAIGLLCNQIKPGIAEVQKRVSLPIVVYDDVLAERAVAASPEGGKIAVIAMKEAPLEAAKQAVLEAADRAGKSVRVEKICVKAARDCLRETGDARLADEYFERYLRSHDSEYSAFVIPQVPLTRIMPRIRDLNTPVFDSMEPFVERLARGR